MSSKERFSDRFVEFFRAIHGVDPFPWQARLAREVCASGTWPKIVDLPTGSGKTACIDVALFHFLASLAEQKVGAAARRVAFVVDRRVIVDEAAERARAIASAIRDQEEPILKEASQLLKEASGSSTIEVFTLRGGVPKERNLVRDPRSAAVVLSTVDQLGSRLLFRGYGVRDNAKPMHAGMFGFDTLLLLDEAHIAEPFLQTLDGIGREQGASPESGRLGVKPLQYVQLSATPKRKAEFELDDRDRTHPVLRRRLEGSKPMRLFEVAKRDDVVKQFVALVTSEIAEHPEDTGEKTRIGVVVNRIATARDVKKALVSTLKGGAEVHLLTGQVRPLDRDDVMAKLSPKLKSSGKPRPGEKPIVVVATQTIEVGADFDFHAMFIEAASYPAVRQRLGRLNRLGLRESARGAIVLVKTGADRDPVYGTTIAATWGFLREHAVDGVVDLGISVAPVPPPSRVEELMPAPPSTPFLTPSMLGLLSQTSPRPAVEPAVADYLHGVAQQRPDVAVVWRDGLYFRDKDADELFPVTQAVADAILEALPPLAAETMTVPLSSVRAWLRGEAKKLDELGDFEGEPDAEDDDLRRPGPSERVVWVLVDDDLRRAYTSQLRPGMTVVVAPEFGGNDSASGFEPTSAEVVPDLSLRARKRAHKRPTLVLSRLFVDAWRRRGEQSDESTLTPAFIETLNERELDEDELVDAISTWFGDHHEALPVDVRDAFKDLSRRDGRAVAFEVEPIAHDDGIAALVLRGTRATAEDLVDDRDGLQRTVDIELDDHLRGVAEYAERFARALGLPASLVEVLRVAGRMHDLGKADPRFQAMLGATGEVLLAKARRVDRRVKLGARHECYSVAMLERHPELYQGVSERDLVRYLVGTHHGRGRALHPVVVDRGTRFSLSVEGTSYAFAGRAGLDALDARWPELYSSLQRRFGPWGLAYLETVLRLADHRRSEDELPKDELRGAS